MESENKEEEHGDRKRLLAPQEEIDYYELQKKIQRLTKPKHEYMTARNTRIRVGKEYQAVIPELPTNKQN